MIASGFRRCLGVLLFLCGTLLINGESKGEDKAGIDWQPWSDNLFSRAAAGHKLVILDLEAGWCHWCHVMDETTYADPRVIGLMREKYIAVRVDQDSRPDLANRYQDYGWPATIIFKWDGSELAKRAGYMPPKQMISVLKAFADDPTPGPSVGNEEAVVTSTEGVLSVDQKAGMRMAFIGMYDGKLGGWGRVQKLLDWNALEYAMTQGSAGDAPMTRMARQTLTAGLRLIDPVWGGVDQYSIDGDWDHPHFEKIIPFQAENMRVYAMAASLWHEPQWLVAAEKIHGYLKNFLTSPEGAFYTSQDADLKPGVYADKYYALDDAGRRKLGVPRVDRHIYARENGLAITGLAALYAASGDGTALADAQRAAEWVIANRGLAGGGFRHDEKDAGGPYLADTLEMGRGFLALYEVTAHRKWLERAEGTADFIATNFQDGTGFATAERTKGVILKPKAGVDENCTLARFANLLGYYSGRASDHLMAVNAMRFLASRAVVVEQGGDRGGILLADGELSREPAHVAVVGAKDDPVARGLFAEALREEPGYARIEWYDVHEGPLMNADVNYPILPKAAAFLCANQLCSPPVTKVEVLGAKLMGVRR